MDFHVLSSISLLFIFLSCTVIIWIAGVKITRAVDAITTHFKLGEAFGGMVFLAIVTNLPEIAITTVAAYHHDYEIAVSNLLGGVAIQTVVLVLIDVFGVGRSAPLTLKGHSRILILEGVALIMILTLVMMAKQFPAQLVFFRTTPIEWLILIIWLGSVYSISRLAKSEETVLEQRQIRLSKLRHPKSPFLGGIQSAMLVLAVGAVLTLGAGWALEYSGEILSKRWHISGVLFGGTILALATALPEISTGIASAKMRDYNMAVSDIFGGNAFLPVLFLVASIISGEAVIPTLSNSDMYLTGLGIILTCIYMVGMVLHARRQVFQMGIDSFCVLLTYLIGLIGLWAIA
ncbi:sodium:calcium antiporter [Aquirufa ecclesiirivi]|uniref:sodium:calcium antiporter n=1 Tax=Aquirufa ecclesiirivi TaxID=2715124 RepID=UPI0022A8CDDA|nr:sodium:calcium antiporter [Aquirufa ecclesiirivi]MCZ2471464.1 sodium:calcium antiporter [Aquirufa ecclesiirivi]